MSYWGEDYGSGRILTALAPKRFPYTIRNTRTGEVPEISYPGAYGPPKPLTLEDFGEDK